MTPLPSRAWSLQPLFPGHPVTAIEAIAVALLAFTVAVVATHWAIGALSARQFGKVIRIDGPDHGAKSGTPTMGGIGMLAAVLVGAVAISLLAADGRLPDASQSGTRRLILTLLATFVFAMLGAIDDLAGLARRGAGRELGVGMTARRMLALQLVAAAAIGWLVADGTPGLGVPTWFDFPGARAAAWTAAPATLLAPVAALVIVATVNGVNMADGLDGLAAGLLATAFAGLAVAIILWQPAAALGATVSGRAWPSTAALALAATGACLGFLLFNRFPARVFMGNVASMGLGACLAVLALLTGTWPLLPVIGAVFVGEVLSDLIQIAYFRRTGGRRILRMAPIHHHFELGGWPETKVVHRFWLAGLACGLAGVGLALALR